MNANVREYLISGDDGEHDLGIHVDLYDRTLSPVGWQSERIPGWGTYRLRIGSTDLIFSDEPGFGWQVVFDGDISETDADAIAAVIAGQLGIATGRPVQVTYIAPDGPPIRF
jgi:hypothetical protein